MAEYRRAHTLPKDVSGVEAKAASTAQVSDAANAWREHKLAQAAAAAADVAL